MSEYLSEEEQIAKMKSWWDENGTMTIAAVVLFVAGIGGWTWYGSYSEERVYDAARAYAAYQQAADEDKAAAGSVLAEDFAGSAYHVFMLFEQARQALAEGDLSLAETHLSEAVAAADDRLLADLARLRLAKVQNGLNRSADALQTLAALTSEGYRAAGLETKGDIHVAKGELELAHAAYEAAIAARPEGQADPVLEMKLKNVAPFEGAYVQFASTLEDALRAAQETLDQAEADAAAETETAAQDAPDAQTSDEADDSSEATPDDTSSDAPATESSESSDD